MSQSEPTDAATREPVHDAPNEPDSVHSSAETADGDDWLEEDLEREYQQALAAMEAAEIELPPLIEGDHDSESLSDDAAEETSSSALQPTASTAVTDEPGNAENSATDRVTPKQIIEAALFVGGAPLTTKKLCSLLRDEFDHDFIEAAIDELNHQYAEENRAYIIQFGEGGYRLALKPEFDRLRRRVFGLGPREVKLSQEALEVLALVAYRQPITAQEIEELGKARPGGVLRQLLRRELIAIERGEGTRRKDVKYHTTPRFLQLFGLGDLDELPQADELSFK